MDVIFFSDRIETFPGHIFRRTAGPYKIASELRSNGYSTKVISLCSYLTLNGYRKIAEKYCTKNTKAICFSTTFLNPLNNDYIKKLENSNEEYIIDILNYGINDNIRSTEINYYFCYPEYFFDKIVEIFKEINPEIKVIFGGTKYLNSNKFIQNIGVGEENILQILNSSTNKTYYGKNDIYNSTKFKNSSIQWIHDDYIIPNEWLFLETARGCAFKCSYCTYEHRGRLDFTRTPESLKKEILRNYELFGTTGYWLTDDLYNDSKDKVQMFHEMFGTLPFKIEFMSYLRLDLLWDNPKMADILISDGLRACSFGIETLNDRSGKAVGKGLGKKRILETLEMLKKSWGNDVIKHANWIVGLPFEDKHSIRETFTFVQERTDLLNSNSFQKLWLSPGNSALIQDINKSFNEYKSTGINEMGINPNTFGYKTENNNTFWDNGLMNSNEADELVQEFKTKIKRENVSFWDYTHMRQHTDHNECLDCITSKSPGDTFYKNSKQLIIKYLNFILN